MLTRDKNGDFFIPTAFDTPVTSEYCCNVSYRKTSMVWLPDDEKIVKIRLFVSTEYTNVTDGQTGRQTDRQTDRATA